MGLNPDEVYNAVCIIDEIAKLLKDEENKK
jgi:hypothetical protein